jgi:hypothetical protein
LEVQTDGRQVFPSKHKCIFSFEILSPEMKEKRILILGLQKQFWQGYFIICAIKLRSGS